MTLNVKINLQIADTIFMNGHVFTQDPEYPWATAVACLKGKILAVGDFQAMGEIVDANTTIHDLQGKFLFPGFIETHQAPALNAFDGKYLELSSDWDLDSIIEMTTHYAEDNLELDTIFAYGANENILDQSVEDPSVNQLLNQIDETRPIVILGESGVRIWYNKVADELIDKGAKEKGISNVTLTFILNLLIPFDFNDVKKEMDDITEDLCDKGITTVLNLCAPEYFEDLFEDCIVNQIEESTIRQRFYGSLYVNRPINERTLLKKLEEKRTGCTEISDNFSYDFLKLTVGNMDSGKYFSQSALNTLCLAAAEKGFNIHVDALCKEALIKTYNAFDLLRSEGYNKNVLIIATDISLTKNEKKEISYYETFVHTWETNLEYGSVYDQSNNATEAIDNYTIYAAELIGASNILGKIEKGKLADFAIFNENPLTLGLDQLKYLHAEQTVIGGKIVYDAEEAAKDELYNLLLTQRL